MVGCHCPVCTSADPRDRRFRCSILLNSVRGKSILIDTCTDLRSQLLDNAISHVDWAFITHDHADHVHGMDDLRPLGFYHPKQERTPIYAAENTANALTERFPYIFRPLSKPLGGGIPRLRLCSFPLIPGEIRPMEIDGEKFHFFLLPHGTKQTLGFCHGKMAYLVDCHDVPHEVVQFLKKEQPEFLVIECVLPKPHETHLGLPKAFDLIREIAPKMAGLTHISHHFSHQALERLAQENFQFPVFPLFDRQEIFYCDEL